MSFNITKYKDWHWCESSGIYNDYFAEIEGTEELPIEFAKELITDCDDLIPIKGKPNHYHKLTSGYYIGFIDYVIYVFKDESVFRQVVEKFEKYFNLQKLFDYFKITEKDFFSFEQGKINDKNSNIISLAYDVANWIIDADEDYGIRDLPASFKKYLKKCIEIFKCIKESSSVMRCSRFIIKRDYFLSYHNFKNIKKNFYV